MKLGELEFKPEDFSRAELQRAFGDNADWFYLRLAEIANLELRERLAKCTRIARHRGYLPGHWVEAEDCPPHDDEAVARIVLIDPMDAAPKAPAPDAERLALIEREIRAMSPENRRRLDELLCKLGEADRARDVTPKGDD